MRRVIRRDLPPKILAQLAKKQHLVDQKHAGDLLIVDAEWKKARQTKPLKRVFATLQTMAGNRERCMYCGDSHGTDIEHFWPKAQYPDRMFRWLNMLLCCSECGRIKGRQFPLDNDQPTLIDPSAENPWESLDFDPQTGNIVARYDLETQQQKPKGVATVRVLQLDRREAMAQGYLLTFRRIKRQIDAMLAQPETDIDTLVQRLSEADDHGLLGWCFIGLGSNISPFVELKHNHPDVWQKCLTAYLDGRL
jgi:uncharacterized protein (TIGR02646 family)